MIYKGFIIEKCKDPELDKGDVGYLTTKEAKDVISPARFLLQEVKLWHQFTDPLDAYHNKREKVLVLFKNRTEVVILETLSNFDKQMEAFDKQKFISIREQ